MRTIHLVATVPQGSSIVRRAIDKCLRLLKITPLYRSGTDALIPWTKPLRSPHASSRNLLHHLKTFGKVKYYSLYEKGVIHLEPDDIFLGQPVPKGGFGPNIHPDTDDRESIVSRTLRENKDTNHNKFIIIPFANNDRLVGYAKDLIKNHTDGTILIGATHWVKNWSNGPFKEIDQKKTLPIDNAVDPSEYPFIKNKFNPPEKRKFLYMGHVGWYKNVLQLEEIARKMPGFEGGHIGLGKIEGWKSHGYEDFTPEFLKKIAEEYDIFVTVSTADAQATTIMEHMCYGFPIACTPETGYEYPSIARLHISDTEANIKTLTWMKNLPEDDLRKMARENLDLIAKNHSWKKYVTRTSDFMGLI